MKITGIQTIALSYTKEHPPIPRIMCLVKVETDAGVTGYGEASTSYGHFYPGVLQAIIEDPISRAVLGKDPMDIQFCRKEMNRYVFPWLGWDGIAAQAVGAVEIALWDILGKVKDTSISKLFGAHKSRISLYATGSTFPEKGPEWHGAFFNKALELGFIGVKTRIAGGVEADIRQIEFVREHVGPEIRLMADGYWAYSLESAIKLARKAEDFDLFWLEEMIPQYMFTGHQKLTAASTAPIATGERLHSLSGFKTLVDYQGADVLQPDVAVCGGLLTGLDVAALGRANDLAVYPHIGGLSGVGMAANLHFAAIIDCDMLEYDFGPYQPLRDEMLKDPIFDPDHLEDGCIRVPDGPGLGVEVDETVFEKYPFEKNLKIYPDIYPQLGTASL